ncbi:hypothetical protein BSU04nite_37670 [Bacillus spizizenii]|nr:hypothetical protein BSU04nite_37670 [Bacillus spizizenii]
MTRTPSKNTQIIISGWIYTGIGLTSTTSIILDRRERVYLEILRSCL